LKFGAEKLLLVGDNPFHGISHLSQERVRDRGNSITTATYAANLVATSVENGANGFMFSVSDTTLSILRMSKSPKSNPLNLYALVPYAYEYVRLATHAGGISGLAKKLARQIAFSGNFKVAALGLKGILRTDVQELMKAYLAYEISRIKSSAKKNGILRSMLLHEVITDMGLALNLDWLFSSYIDFISEFGIRPGFETRNFAYLVKKFKDWNLDLSEILIATPFNKIGFQMNPSKEECEEALAEAPESNVIAMSILASGYLKLPEAIDYVESLPTLRGVVVGVSKEKHAHETFSYLRARAAKFST
jgi:hypothetical protein